MRLREIREAKRTGSVLRKRRVSAPIYSCRAKQRGTAPCAPHAQITISPPQRRLSRLEGQYLVCSPALPTRTQAADLGEQVMQSQMIGMQSSLDRIMSAIQNPALV